MTMACIPESLTASALKTLPDAKTVDLTDDWAVVAALGQVIATVEVLLETVKGGEQR